MTTATESTYAWWFCPTDLKLGHGDNRAIVVGETLTVTGDIIPCQNGLHASVKPLDALTYGQTTIACYVRMGGTIVHNTDKLAASERTVIAMKDCTKELRLFAVWCAEQAMEALRKRGVEPDPRSLNAIAVARKHANGDATDAELAADWDAARAAAWAADWDAARAADWDAARAAAWAAAGAGAGDAAGAAAWAAARAAAGDAAGAAAGDAAGDAAGAADFDRYSAELDRILKEALGVS